jgi:hypothetical protein
VLFRSHRSNLKKKIHYFKTSPIAYKTQFYNVNLLPTFYCGVSDVCAPNKVRARADTMIMTAEGEGGVSVCVGYYHFTINQTTSECTV